MVQSNTQERFSSSTLQSELEGRRTWNGGEIQQGPMSTGLTQKGLNQDDVGAKKKKTGQL